MRCLHIPDGCVVQSAWLFIWKSATQQPNYDACEPTSLIRIAVRERHIELRERMPISDVGNLLTCKLYACEADIRYAAVEV